MTNTREIAVAVRYAMEAYRKGTISEDTLRLLLAGAMASSLEAMVTQRMQRLDGYLERHLQKLTRAEYE